MSVAWFGKDVGSLVNVTQASVAGGTPSGEDWDMNVQGTQIAPLDDS